MSTVECQSCPAWLDADEAIWIGDKTYCEGCEPVSDITMCANKSCPLERICYRKTATPNIHWQSVAMFRPRQIAPDDIVCDHFIRSRTPTGEEHE